VAGLLPLASGPAEMKYMRRTAGYTWTNYKTNKQITKELKITPILDTLLEYKRKWIQHVNRMPRNRLPRVMKHYFSNWQKESWKTFEETSGYVRPEVAQLHDRYMMMMMNCSHYTVYRNCSHCTRNLTYA
jgi:hypothetical protein